MTRREHFTERLSLAEAWAWLDACPDVSGAESVGLDQAFGRILSEPLYFPADRPDRDLALVDGYAVLAANTLGASSYNPLFLALLPKGVGVATGCAVPCQWGETLPSGADAVLPLEAGETVGDVLEVCAVVARGSGVGRKGEAARRGDLAIETGLRLDAPQIALVASLGVTKLNVRRRPDVALFIAGAKPPSNEALSAAIAALARRDGGVPHWERRPGDVAQALRSLTRADIVLLIGRSGRGKDDDSVEAFAAAGGRIDHHGLALAPGGSTGLGWLGDAPVLLLPGDPLAALATYELLAGRLLRRLAGRPADVPYPVQRFSLTRKIASPIGVSEWVPLLCHGATAEPLALTPADGLAGYVRANGFLVVPAGLEGYAAGTLVDVAVTASDISRRERS